MIRLDIGATSEVGQVRTLNEDAYLSADGLAVVADGMGGHRAGEVASAATVDVLAGVEGNRSLDDQVRAVHRANREISERSAGDPDLMGMGTTVCVVGLVRREDRDEIAVLNVGDSRVYLFADGTLTQLTEDHSLVETLVHEGRLTPEEARDHPQKNVLTRALGVEPLVVVDAWLLEPRDKDRILLCSDGLTNELSDERIAEILSEPEGPEVLARRLVAAADAAGGRDNITALVADVSGTGEDPAPIGDRFRRITTPAVDLSDEHGPHTETVLAVVDTGGATDADGDAPVDSQEPSTVDAADPDSDPGGTDPSDPTDLVGGDPEIAALAASNREQNESLELEIARANRWRTAAFVLAILAVLGLAVGAIAFTARQGFYVGENPEGYIALYKGTPVLWLKPTEIDRTDLQVEDLDPAEQSEVRGGRTFSSEVDARRRLENFTTTTVAPPRTTTTTTTTTTSTAPRQSAPPATNPTGPSATPSTTAPASGTPSGP